MSRRVNALPWAERYHELGYTVIPLKTGAKQACIKWKQFQDASPRLSEKQLRKWFWRTDHNIAIVPTGDIVVVDCDNPELLELVVKEAGATPMSCSTPRGGVHCYYRTRKGVALSNQVRINGKRIDLRCKGGYAVVPPSRIDGITYSWIGENVISPDQLPVFRVSWTRSRKRQTVKEFVPQPDQDGNAMIRRARAYLAHIEGAVSGQRGHDKTFRVACKLVVFGLTFEQAWPLFLNWNQTCQPPWTEKELKHKLNGALRVARERS